MTDLGQMGRVVIIIFVETSSTNQLNLSGVDEDPKKTEKDTKKTWKTKLGSGGSLPPEGRQVTQFIF